MSAASTEPPSSGSLGADLQLRMADFCKGCAEQQIGKDTGDLANLTSPAEWGMGRAARVLCEGCGFTEVDPEGNCVSEDCMRKGKPGHGLPWKVPPRCDIWHGSESCPNPAEGHLADGTRTCLPCAISFVTEREGMAALEGSCVPCARGAGHYEVGAQLDNSTADKVGEALRPKSQGRPIQGPTASEVRVGLVSERMRFVISQVGGEDLADIKAMPDEDWLESFRGEIPATLDEIRLARKACGIALEHPVPPTPLLDSLLTARLAPDRDLLIFSVDGCAVRFNRHDMDGLVSELASLRDLMTPNPKD